MFYLVFCDVDEEGNITDALVGTNIIPNRQYDYFFFTSDEGVTNNINQYKVNTSSRQLEKIEG